MDKNTYLKQLEAALRERYPEPQVRDILADYEDFFATGVAEGESEAELCTEFGTPEQAARELKSESETEAPQRGKKRSALAVSLLAIFILAVLLFFFGPRFESVRYGLHIPDGPINFWLAMLFPLAFEIVIAILLSQNISGKRKAKWVPIVQAVLAVPVTAALVLLIYYTQSAPWLFNKNVLDRGMLMGDITATMTYAACLILVVSIILLVFYVIRGHKQAHWFLFLDTTILMLMLNLVSFLSHIGPESYDGLKGTASSIFWAVLPNLAAMGIYWIIQKVISTRKPREAKAWTGK